MPRGRKAIVDSSLLKAALAGYEQMHRNLKAKVECGGAQKDRGGTAKTLGLGQSEADKTKTHDECGNPQDNCGGSVEALGGSKKGASKSRHQASGEEGGFREGRAENGESGIVK